MAYVVSVGKDEREISSLHPTRLTCRYMVGEQDGVKLLQLNSYGSEDRAVPDKLSQTLQFDESSARQLFEIIRAEFGF
ncbi:hypothetical protein [Cereibacter sphaeroides]|uniref:hypothetical protein n=1 Tax=Cereibacter sphaeroides TaxID=1063 RepID=UPI001F324EEC|nr:hypothetical protein [Cereibacter sphaeroides]MCE6968777.1 hypothetical protein [Cereibacter sphaeroides]